MAASRSLPARAASATSTFAPGELQLLDLVDRGRVRLRATTPDGKALRATELAGRQSLGLQAGERQLLPPDLQRRRRHRTDPDPHPAPHPADPPALDSPAPQSPTLQRLQAELAEKRPGALKAFWKQVAKQGTPLVEPLDAERVLVTSGASSVPATCACCGRPRRSTPAASRPWPAATCAT